MRISYVVGRAATLACLSVLILPSFSTASAAELRTLATVPSNGLEGMDVAPDGSIYLTNATAHVIHKIDASGQVSEFSNVGAAVQVILLTPSGAIVTGQQRDPDFAALMGGRPSGPPPGSDAGNTGAPPPPPGPPGISAGIMGQLGAELIFLNHAGKVVRSIRGPEGAFLNGIARFGKNFLIADSALGTIWLYEPNASQLVLWFKSDSLLGPNGRFPGANGLKVLNDVVYVSNTAGGTIYKLKTARGKPAGDLIEFARIASPDDFSVARDGTVYLPSDGKVVRISPTGQQTVLVENCKGCDSALLTDHERSLLLVTHGFGANAGPGIVYSLPISKP